MSDFWVVVADESAARLFSSDRIRVELTDIETLTNPDARLHERELDSAPPGRSFDRGGQGRHAVEPENNTRREHARRFARNIADKLEDALKSGLYQRLIMIAPPDFLGLLRRHLPDEVMSRVQLDLSKNLVREKTGVILKHIVAGRG